MIAKTLASIAAGEVLIIAAVIGIGVGVESAGLVAFGAVWFVPVVIDHWRGRS